MGGTGDIRSRVAKMLYDNRAAGGAGNAGALTERSDQAAPSRAVESGLNPADIICFTEGTAIETELGERRIEAFRPGDFVMTLDNGPQPIRWIGRETVRATGDLAPIRFSSGTLGNHRDLLVSPQHRMLCTGTLPRRCFGKTEVLAPAKSLIDNFNVTVAYGGMVTYIHLLFDRHEIVIANGAPSESFFPGQSELGTLRAQSREDLFDVFPKLRGDPGSYGPASRACLRADHARVLATA